MELLKRLNQVNVMGLARKMGIPPTTIYAWRNNKKIPVWRIKELTEAIETEKIKKSFKGD